MSEIMSKAVREALNDPVKRFLLIDAYLERKSREIQGPKKLKDSDQASSEPSNIAKRKPPTRPGQK